MSVTDPPTGALVEISTGKGIVRFCGTTSFAPGKWVGIELFESKGKNDGSIQGVAYFSCRPLYGVFIRPSQVKILATESEQPPVNVSLHCSTTTIGGRHSSRLASATEYFASRGRPSAHFQHRPHPPHPIALRSYKRYLFLPLVQPSQTPGIGDFHALTTRVKSSYISSRTAVLPRETHSGTLPPTTQVLPSSINHRQCTGQPFPALYTCDGTASPSPVVISAR
jgi:hypothetical protein